MSFIDDVKGYITDNILNGLKTCPRCGGSGNNFNMGTQKKQDGFITDAVIFRCKYCNGTGKVPIFVSPVG